MVRPIRRKTTRFPYENHVVSEENTTILPLARNREERLSLYENPSEALGLTSFPPVNACVFGRESRLEARRQPVGDRPQDLGPDSERLQFLIGETDSRVVDEQMVR